MRKLTFRQQTIKKIIYTFARFFDLANKIMSLEEQQEYRTARHTEALRYMANASDTLSQANKVDNFYQDQKYVRSACGIAYLGVLIALDAFFALRGVELPKKKRRSIEFYTATIAKIDKKMLNYLNSAYDTLHLSGYYDGNCDAVVIKRGFDVAYEIIDKIKPLTI
jgi:hypothetical protein